ncbi:lysoplasmalogenase [Rhodobacter sp. SY28-1]|uniref:lysoplasmalogenase n=1 Tax=Rhodobacter sp. SY28-1 TaxID=2562317 RepID=UPI0010C0BC39|nr:lysoplasmalogenase [Rhodobacter sp. SY28-1]
MPDNLGEMLALATALMSLVAALAYWVLFATREVKGTAGAVVKTASTALLAVLALAMPYGGWFWLIPLGLALGALGDLFLALGGMRRFLAGVAAFGLGHLAYTGGFLWRSGEIGFDGLSVVEQVALGLLLVLLLSTEGWLAPRTGELRQPVRGYVGLIGLMGVAAVLLPAHPGQEVLRLGAALFILSDLMLALQLFVVKDQGARRGLALALWPAYWAGQALIAWGAVSHAG